MSGEKSGNYGTGKENNSWPCIRELAQTKGKPDADHSISDRLLEIINDILDFSKIEAGKLTLDRIEFGIRQIVEEAVDLFAEPAGEKGLELMCFIPHEIPDAVIGDPVRLRQILLNLLGNAVKFTARGEVALRVRQVSGQDRTLTLRFEVADTGIGLTTDAKDRLSYKRQLKQRTAPV